MKRLIKPQACKTIEEVRGAIDVIDREILLLLSKRLEYVKEIVKFKSGDDEGIIARDRQELVLKQRKAWAEKWGLDGDMVEEIFRLMIHKNIQIQFDIYQSNNKS